MRVELEPGIVSVVGPNGAGKTNLLEALYFALTGRSFRTADRRDLIPFGGALARAEVDGPRRRRHRAPRCSPRSAAAEGRRHLLDGSPADPATLARHRPPVAVFAPDRLSLVKGPPAERRAHLDGFVAARWPVAGRAAPALRPGARAAQRAARADRGGLRQPRPSSTSGTPALAEAAAPLVAARAEAVAELAAPLRRRRGGARARGRRHARLRAARARVDAEEIRAGLRGAARGRPAPRPQLLGPAPRRAQDRSRGGRSLRRYGSQGQQRAALLALLFAEREALLEARRVDPAAAARRRDERARPRAAGAPRRAARRRRPGADHRRRRGVAAGRRRAREVVRDAGGRRRGPTPPRRHEPPPRPAPRRRGLPRGAATGPRRRPRLAAVQAAWAEASASASPRSRDAGLRARRHDHGRLRGRGLGAGARPDAGGAARSGLRERLGESGAAERCASVSKDDRYSAQFLRDLQGFCDARRAGSGGSNWYPYGNSLLAPTRVRAEPPGVGVFCDKRKGLIA